MATTNEIEQLIQASLAAGREKVAAARQEQMAKTASDDVDEVDKLATALQHLAKNPGDIIKLSEVGAYTGTDSPAVQPPTDEARSTTETQSKETEGPSPHTAQEGTETEPGTDEGRDTHTDNTAPAAAVTETPSVPEKVAGAENESAESPTEYAAEDGTPISTRIPFLADHSAVQAFNKRQAKQVSVVDTLKGVFTETPYDDGVVQRNLDHAEEAGVKTRSGGI